MKTKILNLVRQVFRLPLLEKALTKLTLGKSPDDLISRLPANHYQYPKFSFRNVVRDGINYKLDLSDAVDWYIYFGFREQSRMKLYALVKPGDVVFDIGANVGDITLHLAKITGEKGAVFSFEPDPFNFKRFKENVGLNTFKNIHANNLGLGNKAGKFKMALFRTDNRGMTRIVDTPSSAVHAEVEITTLDEFLNSHLLPPRVNLVKIDVEGYETNVLKGATQFLQKYKPVLFIEVVDDHLREQHTTARELVSLLESLNYTCKHSETGKPFTSANDFTNCHFDLIAENRA